MRIEIFTGPGCSYCEAAKALLDARGLAYEAHDMTDPDVRADYAARLPREKSIPQIFIDGVHIGGAEDLRDHFNRG
ncbi:glutaredoxin domain-containing protein [Roseovarius autotrophicus]|uniref:glutaredoxin domain-containing protein n=1 Tax=Roseovarius autotrophicus TaxID=2824121 RepID=UPI001FFD1462|nr:glutaredoxin domain-containing protein [Roseovarius autotrophicus]